MNDAKGTERRTAPTFVGEVDDPPSRWRILRVPRRHWIFRDPRFLFSGFVIVGLLFVAISTPIIAPHDPLTMGDSLQRPSSQHWLGTDELGRSVLSRLMFGARTSLQIGIFATLISTVGGALLGVVAGYYRGKVDMIIMRTMDVMFAFPTIVLAIAVVTFLGNTVLNLIIVIGVLNIPNTARIVYTTTLFVSTMEYVSAARAVGATNKRIIFRHVFPNTTGPLLVHTALALGFAILTESGLSFLGLGPPPPEPTWGQMIAIGRRYIHQQPLLLITPMVVLSVAIIAFNLAADVLRDMLDPRSMRG